MKSKIMAIILFAVANSISAQLIPGVFPQYHYQDNSDNTSSIRLTTQRLRNFQIILDDSTKLRVLGKTIFRRFTIKNVPAGNHKIVVVQNNLWPFKEPYNHEFTVLSNGNGENILVELPKRRYCNAFYIATGGLVAAFGGFIYLLSTIDPRSF